MKIVRSKWLSVGWFVLMCVLFFLPGSSLPKENKWMALISFDKWVHTGLFAILLFLWNTSFNKGIRFFELYLLLSAVLFGLSVEIIQREWIPNRSFDLYDLAADTLGSILGLVIWWRIYKKNKPL